ncbi:DUF1501 domain-containing protein [Blastopirellula marina]|uniref:DUF1501 domain-containing protein n=1 Tax=Blastopirellula marina DSM 3645 TaxID=314230 RepID=A3ZQC8_9BACT|nr:DUF1501 domain-containing protein [Blastopirellula marina]EAQ81404.1 hypothetical protein DSM3645_23471 [Blastopirellula marina DSM 3645]
MFKSPTSHLDRRQFLAAGATAAGLAAAPTWAAAAASPRVQGQAEHVISIWLGGGMSQIDTFDPKAKGNPGKQKAGAYYDPIPTAVDGVSVCEHLPKVAGLMDRVTAVRTVHHSVIDEHAAATNWMHVGRPVSGTVVYPSLGSIISHERGALSESAPSYVLIGYPNSSRGPGFLGAQHSYLYLTETGRGPAGLSRHLTVTAERQKRRDQLLTQVRSEQPPTSDKFLQDYDAAAALSLRLSGPDFMRSFELESEPAALRESYGGEFGQRCLLSRRLVERGVRFIEVSHNLNFLNGAGWDVHNRGILDQHKLIHELDDALSALISDLENRKLLDKTLIVVTTEFGRPPQFDGGGGRGHQGSTFTCVLAGGGLKHQGAYGQTDDLSQNIAADPVSVPDFFATIHAAMGIDYAKSLYDGDRPVPITDGGQPIAPLFG